MRGSDQQTGSLFRYLNLEERVPARHPLRKIKAVVDAALASLDADFSALYADEGRPSIAPELCFGRRWCRSCSRSAPSGS